MKNLYFKNELSKVFTLKNDIIVTQKSFWKNFKVNDIEISIAEGNYSKNELISAVSASLTSELGAGNEASYLSLIHI